MILDVRNIQKRALFLGFLWFLTYSIPASGGNTLTLPVENGGPKHLRHIHFYTEPSLSLDAEEMSRLFSSPSLAEKMMRVDQYQIIISQSAYWARIDIQNPGDYQQAITVFLNNPLLDSVQFFRDDGLGMYEAGIAGLLVDLSRWSHPDRLPSLPIHVKPGMRVVLLIRVRNTLSTRMISPIFVASTSSYAEFSRKESALWALKLGLLLCLGLLALFLAATEGRLLYLWPSLIAFTLSLLSVVKSGHAREFGWLLHGGTANHVTWVLVVILYVLYVRFGMAFLRTSRSVPLLHRWLNGISLGVAIIVPLYALLWPYMKEWHHSIIPAIMILQLPGLFLMLWSCIFAYPLAKHRSVALFAATLSLIVCGFLEAYGSRPWLKILDIFGFSVFPGALIALGIITWESFYELYLQRKRREQLSNLLLRKQQNVERSFVLGQEAERCRIGQELHDHLAALLLNARMMMPADKEDQTEWDSKEWEGYRRGLISLDLGLNEVRALSYQLDPNPMNASRLKDELARLLRNLNISRPSCAFHLDFEILNTSLNPATALDLYRICQECLSNIVKHSAATSVYVELTQKDEKIQMCVADNGVGFETAKARQGIGLKSVRNRLRRMKNHTVRIESTPGRGTSVYVSFLNEVDDNFPLRAIN
ncbi:MAG: hypothetical protein FJ344_03435 [Sphingomonadales bacterium]|nr:hypothetical protein [Sphingomonadales bacterium]